MHRNSLFSRRWRLDVVALSVVALFGGSQAHALLIEIEPDSLDVTVGDPVSLDIFARSLDTDLIGGFDIDLAFDGDQLAFNSVSFGTGLGDPDPDLFDSLVDTCLGGELFCPADLGQINLFQVSLLDSATLAALQPGNDLLLFNIVFDTLAPGFSEVSFARTDISDETGLSSLQVTSTSGTTINASDDPVPVPAPSVLSLLGIGLLSMLLARLPRMRVRRPF